MPLNLLLGVALSAIVLMPVIGVALAANSNGVCSSTLGNYKGRIFPNHHINSTDNFLNQSAVATVHGCRHLCEIQPEGCIALSFSPPPAKKDNCMLYNLTSIQKFLSPKPGHIVILLLPMECGKNSTVDGGWSSWQQSNDCWTAQCKERRRCDHPKCACNGDECFGDDQRLARIRPLTDLGMTCNLTEEGIYTFNLSGKAFDALVTMSPNEQASIVIQRRYDGSIDFVKMWDDYKRGFGNLSGEFWLGNDNIHFLTSQQNVSLKIQLNDGNETRFALYEAFGVASEEEKYTLSLENYAEGDAGDSFSRHNGLFFTTQDRDNDLKPTENCAELLQSGGWWFRGCHWVNLNGPYVRGLAPQGIGINWKDFRGYEFALHKSEMKILVCG